MTTMFGRMRGEGEGKGKGKDMSNGKRKGEEKDGVIPWICLDARKKK